MLVFWITLCLCVRSAERAGSPCRGYCFRYCMDGTVIRVPCCWSGTNIDTTTLNSVARLGSKISSEAVTHEREQGDRLKPAIKCHSSPFRWAKSTAPLASPTQQVRTPGFCYCWSVRLEQSPRPCPQPERHRSCFQAPAEEIFFVLTILAHRAHEGSLPVMGYTNLHLLTFDFVILKPNV